MKSKEQNQTKVESISELIDSGQFERAEQLVKKTWIKDDPMAIIHQAEIAIYFARLDEAEELLDQIELRELGIEQAARYTLARGEWHYWRYQYEEAEKRFEAANYMYELLNDPLGKAWALYNLGRLARRTAKYQEAEEMLDQAEQLMIGDSEAEHTFLRGLLEFNLGACKHDMGEVEAAAEHYQSSIRLLRQTEGCRYFGLALNAYGQSLTRLGRYAEALNVYKEASDIFERLGTLDDLARVTSNLGWVLMRLKQFAEAEAYLKRGIEIHQRIGDIAGTAGCRGFLAGLCLETGELDKAEKCAAMNIEEADLAQNENEQSDAHLTAGLVALKKGDYKEAEKQFQIAFEIAQRLDNKKLKAAAFVYLTECYLSTAPVRGLEYLAEAEALLQHYHDAWLREEFERVADRYRRERIRITEDNKFFVDGNFLPTWYEAKQALGMFILKNALEQCGYSLTKVGKKLGITKAAVHELRKKYKI